jgi:hypothetical protein
LGEQCKLLIKRNNRKIKVKLGSYFRGRSETLLTSWTKFLVNIFNRYAQFKSFTEKTRGTLETRSRRATCAEFSKVMDREVARGRGNVVD